MNKKLFERFFELCHVSDECKSYLFETNNNTTSASSISNDKMIICKVNIIDNEKLFPSGKFALYDIDNIIKVMPVLTEEDFRVEYNRVDTMYNKVILSSDNSNIMAEIFLSDFDVIPNIPKLKNIEKWDLIFSMTKDDIDKFNKARNAIPETKIMLISCNGLTIGDSEYNSNKIVLKIKDLVVNDYDAKPRFIVDYFKNILSVIKDDVTVYVIGDGLMKINYKNKQFSNDYYIIGISNEA